VPVALVSSSAILASLCGDPNSFMGGLSSLPGSMVPCSRICNLPLSSLKITSTRVHKLYLLYADTDAKPSHRTT
ncbi:hypothetical protein KC19_VG025600, partial [Ceratodon purpureus]